MSSASSVQDPNDKQKYASLDPARKWYRDKTFYLNLIRRCVAEFVGTMLYVFTGTTAIGNFLHTATPHLPTVALAYGFTYAGLVAATVNISGGHLNPAVTLGMFIAGGVNAVAACCYVVVQVLGAVVGAAFVLSFDAQFTNTTIAADNVSYHGQILVVACTKLADGINPIQGIMVEMMLTMALVVVFVCTLLDRTGQLKSTAPALAGLTTAAGILAGYELTGGSLNPARSFGPLLILWDKALWNDHYVYWLGPLLGAAIAGGLHRMILSDRPLLPLYKEEQQHQNCLQKF